jgi:hypothetical protein
MSARLACGSTNNKVLDYGLGLDVAYNVGHNMWLTLGYNLAVFTFHDQGRSKPAKKNRGTMMKTDAVGKPLTDK